MLNSRVVEGPIAGVDYAPRGGTLTVHSTNPYDTMHSGFSTGVLAGSIVGAVVAGLFLAAVPLALYLRSESILLS